MEQQSTKNISSTDAIEEIKSRLDIVETVSEQVVLKKAGKNYWGLCPFHKEKTPSFSVNAERGIYKCFGCGEGGDSISFMMKTQNMSFWETIVMLAGKFGIELPQAGVSKEKKEIKEQILEVNKVAVEFFKKQLLESNEASLARDYLLKRDINEDIIERFNLGFSQNNYDALIKYLTSKKYSQDLLFKAGLTSEKSNGSGYVDRFRNRVMIPIQNEKGEFIAFGARALSNSEQPKYLNSPESLVFHKNRSLFAIHQAKDAIKEQDSVVLMEGYFDVISAHVHGINNVVATLGTALSEQHIRVISRFSPSRKIFLAFDSDAAGIAATNRSGEIIKSAFAGLGEVRHFDESFADTTVSKDRTVCEIRVISSQKGKDPDEFLRAEGVEAYRELMQKAPLLIDYQINRLISMKDSVDSPQAKANLSSEILPLLAEINNSIIRNEYIKLVSEKLGVNEESLNIEVRKTLQKVTLQEKNKDNFLIASNKGDKHILAQRNLLGLYFLNTEKITPLCINNYLREVKFTEPEFELIERSIEALVKEVNDSNVLFEKLLTEFVDNEQVKKYLTDMVYFIEDKKDLSFDSIEQYIKDHVNYLNSYQINQSHNKLRSDYYEDNKDDTSSLRHQQEVLKLLEERRAGTCSK